MDAATFEIFIQHLRTRLETFPFVLGLVTLGSTADQSLRDEWSDHDCWVITEPGAQNSFLNDLSWLPEHEQIALVVRHGKHHRAVLYHNRHKVEFAVFDFNEATAGKVERFQVLIDRGGVAEFIESIHQESLKSTRTKPEALENLCVLVWSACERYRRGELLSARQYIDGFAVNELLKLISDYEKRTTVRDELDPRRRIEQRSPALANDLLSVSGQSIPSAALHLLEIAERDLKPHAATLPWDKVAMVRLWILELIQTTPRK